MNSEKNFEYFEVTLEFLLAITSDIMEHAINAGIDLKALNKCVVRIPREYEKNRFYEIGV